MVERWPFKPMVVGSIPTVGDQDKIIISEMPGSDPGLVGYETIM